MFIEKSFVDLEDAMYFLDMELYSSLLDQHLSDLVEAGIRWIPQSHRWQAYVRTKEKNED